MEIKSRRRLDFLWQEWKDPQVQIKSLNAELEQIAICIERDWK